MSFEKFDERVREELESKKVLCKGHYDECLKFWNEDISMAIYPIQEKVLNEIWNDKKFSEPTEKNIRFKCVILDKYYSTNLKEGLYRNSDETEEKHPIVTDKIDKCFIEEVKSVRKDDNEKIISLVEHLSPVYSTQTEIKIATSFASKFCSRYNPEAFPIYDKLVRRMLYLINQNPEYCFSEERITWGSLVNNYGNYKKAVDLFMKKFGDKLPEMKTYKDFDQYMWSWAKMVLNDINDDVDDSELQ